MSNKIYRDDVTKWNYDGELFHAMLCDPPYHLKSIVDRFGGKNSAPAKHGTDGVFSRASKGFMGKCYDKDTELLTEDGWQNITEIVKKKYSGKFYSLNPENNGVELVEAIDFMRYPYRGDMLHFTGRSIDLLVTPNHDLWIQKQNKKISFVRADKVPANFYMFNQGRWLAGKEPKTIKISNKKYPSEAFMKFLGLYLGDGCVAERKSHKEKQNFICLSGKSERKKVAFRKCLEELGVKFSQYEKQTLIYDKNLENFLIPLGKALDKYIPKQIFNYSQKLLLLLLEGLLETDGYRNDSGKTIQFFTSSKQLADDVQRLALHCNLSATTGTRPAKEVTIQDIKTKGSKAYVLSFLANNKKLWFEKVDHKSKKKRLQQTFYNDYVYDVTLEKNHILMTRRNGRTIWSSNSWDGGDVSSNPETWHHLKQFLYPGAFCMAFSSTRTVHRMMVAIEDAGFIIHPIIAWVQGQGFPKATRIKQNKQDVEQFEGYRYGLQALKPSFEPIVVFQKPYEGKPVENMIETGAGAINIDGGRIGHNEETKLANRKPRKGTVFTDETCGFKAEYTSLASANIKGRWPANFILGHTPDCKIIGTRKADSYQINRFTDGAKPWGNGAGHEFESETIEQGEVPVWECVDGCPVKAMDEQSGNSTSSGGSGKASMKIAPTDGIYGKYKEGHKAQNLGCLGDKGGASRFFFQSHHQLEQTDPFFYCPKASKKEKNLGVEEGCSHPTIKPLKLTQYLATLLLPPSEYAPRRILVPFAGTGSEMIGAHLAGWEHIVGIEKEQEYLEIAEQRLAHWTKETVIQLRLDM